MAAFFAAAAGICSAPSQPRKGLSRFCASHSGFRGLVIRRSIPGLPFQSCFAAFAAVSGRLVIQNQRSSGICSGVGMSAAPKPNRSKVERFVSSRNPSTAEKFPRFPGAPQSRSSFRWGWTAASLVRSKSFSSMPCSPRRFGSSVCGRYSPINWRVKPPPSSGAWMAQASGPLFWNRSCSVPSHSHSSSSPVMSSISFLMLVPRRSSVL